MKKRLPKILITLFFSLCIYVSFGRGDVHAQTGGASLYLSPANGTFEVGSTFDVSLLVNTGGSPINAVKVEMVFPVDKLQVVNPHVGKSFISIWITQPHYSNVDGTLHFEGGLPNPGVDTSSGLISTVTFRVMSPGTASISLLSSCQVLANDGQGTNVLTSISGGNYTLSIPSPEGPIITSPSHPDRNSWYRDNNVQFNWELGEVVFENAGEYGVEYSWEFNEDPKGIPDNKSEGKKTTKYYEEVEDGIWYFHVKANIGGVWGKTGHYIVRIDTESPAQFTPEVLRQSRSSDVRRVVRFDTTDRLSGVDHYEVKVDSLTDDTLDITLFAEQTSPWIMPELPVGEYEVTVKALDKAGNWTDEVASFTVRRDFFGLVIHNGIGIGSFFLSWWIIAPVLIVIVGAFLSIRYVITRRVKRNERLISDILDKSEKRVEKEKADYEEVLKTAEEVKSALKKKIDSHPVQETTLNREDPHSINFLKEEDGFQAKK